MKNKLIICILALICVVFSACEDADLVGTPATIRVKAFDRGRPLTNAKVYMFDEGHKPGSSFFSPMFADTTAVTDNYGTATFYPEVFGSIETFYFALFVDKECIGYTEVSTSGGDIRDAELYVGGTPQTFTLKEVLRETTLNCHSLSYQGDANNRTYVPIKLPKNTVSVAYSVSSNFAGNTSPTLDLLADLMRHYDPTNGLLADIIASLDAPTGTADCSLYLIKDNESLDLFNDKSGNFQYYPEGSRRNFLGGIVDVDLDEPLTENTMWYLGIENPDDKDDIIITIEVCALVLEEE